MLLNDVIIKNVEKEAYFNAGRRDGMEEGIQKGIHSTKIEMVINMHNKGVSIELIGEYTNLTTLEVEEIINQNKN